jgi:hypothetical protein
MWSSRFDPTWHTEGTPECVRPGDTWDTDVVFHSNLIVNLGAQSKTRTEMKTGADCGGNTVANGDTTEKRCDLTFDAVSGIVEYLMHDRDGFARIVPVGSEYAVTDLGGTDDYARNKGIPLSS